ncbi:MAG: polyprenyl synthetase family protein [Bacteroidetes bacterium]|nr:MAG: polyprenyl synthetase family protein [Bacteroidota bacterium]
MNSLKYIKKPVSVHLTEFNKVFRSAVKSNTALLDIIMQYILKSKGKQIRPIIVLYSAGLTGEINPSTYRAATLVELLHTATLVHDDVVDESYQRRGRFSINAIWRNKIAVLAGDFLLSRGMLLAVENGDHQMLEIVSRAVKEMSEGELLQIEKARKLDIDEAVYFDIIRRKTASLLASCFAVGAASTDSDDEVVTKMHKIGENLGMAFQIKDDLLDFGAGDNIGKPTGIDIKEKKMTLPLIYLINHSNKKEKREYINIVKNHSEDKQKVNWLVDRVKQSGGMEYTIKKMTEFEEEALALLNTFRKNESRTMLKEIIRFTIDRKK